MLTEQQLLKMKKEVESAKTAISEINGQMNAVYDQLKNDWNCSSIEEAELKLVKLKEEVDTLSAQIEEGCDELEELYGQL